MHEDIPNLVLLKVIPDCGIGKPGAVQDCMPDLFPNLPVRPVKMKVSNLPAALVKMEDTKDSLMYDPVVADIVTN